MACSVCEGTGWKPVDEAGYRRVTRCECWRSTLADRQRAEARIPRRYQHCDFDRFVTYGNDLLIRAVTRARRLAVEFPVVERGLFLLGPPGVGKTHLAVATLSEIIRRAGARGLFYDTRDLLRVIRSTYDPVVRTTEIQVLRPVMEADVLLLDDLGAEKTSEWVEETLNLIVNTRYSERRLTLFTSNYLDTPDDTDPHSLLFRIGMRIRSRLHEMCDFLDLDGADYRLLQPNEDETALRRNWEERRMRKRVLPSRADRPARAQVREARAELKWPGGRAGS